MSLVIFSKSHEYLDKIGVSRLDDYTDNVKIEQFDFSEQENKGDVEWRPDGIYLKIRGLYRRGYMYNKNYRVSVYGNPKFHLYECSVLEKFNDKGTLSRYYFWSNSNIVTVIDRDTKEEIHNQKLDLCSRCNSLLNENNLESVGDTEYFHNLLDINDKEVTNNLGDSKKDIYNRPLNWKSVSKAYRTEQNFTCEECGFGGNDLESNYDKRHIHTHHIDGYDLMNTHRDNLMALCELCHYNQDEHHISNFEKPRLKIPLKSFVKKYKLRLKELNNPYLEDYLRNNQL